MIRALEDYQLIGRACKHSNMFSLPVLTPEDLTTSYVQLLLRRNTIKRISNKFLLLELVFYVVLKVQTFNHSGGDYLEVTPVPIPNTEVKLNGAEDT